MLCYFLGLDTPVWHCLCKDRSNHFFFKDKLKSPKLKSTYFCDYQTWLELLLDFILQKKLIILVYTYLVYTSHACIKVKWFQYHFPSRDIEEISWLQNKSKKVLVLFTYDLLSCLALFPSVCSVTHSHFVLVLCTANSSVLQATLLQTKRLMCMFYVCLSYLLSIGLCFFLAWFANFRSPGSTWSTPTLWVTLVFVMVTLPSIS